MNWLRKLLGLERRDRLIADLTLRLKRGQTIQPLRHDETYTWNASDASAWKSFIGSDLGKKFIAVTRAAHYRMLQSASASQLYAAQEVHCARGFFECIKWMHLMTVPPSSGASEQNNTVAGAGDSTATDPVLDESLERYSPK